VGENMYTVQKNKEALLDASKKVGQEVNPGKLNICKKAGQRHSMKIADRSFEGVAKFKYLGTTLTDQD
jgi:hypothetical protein